MRRETRVRRGLVQTAVLWLTLCGLEVALVGKIDPQETPVGVAVALLAAVMTAFGAAAADLQYGFQPGWVWLPLLVVRNVARDTFVVAGVVLRQLFGRDARDAYLEIPFDPGADDAVSAARRALVVAAVSTSPNEIVLGIDRHARKLRVHVLARTGSSKHSREWPL